MTDLSIHHPRMPLSGAEAMGMNRHERRSLGKLNGVKIPGSNNAHIRIAVIKKMKERKMPQYLIDFYSKENRMPNEEEFKTLQDASKKG